MSEPPAVVDGPPAGELERLRRLVAAYVAAGADESVQQVITSVHRLAKRLDQWYDRQLADIDVTTAEWAVLSELARADGAPLTPGQLATATNVAPSSMTHRLDRLVARGLVSRGTDPLHRSRVLVRLSDDGYQLYVDAIRDADLKESQVLESLTPDEVRRLGELLSMVIAGLDASLP